MVPKTLGVILLGCRKHVFHENAPGKVEDWDRDFRRIGLMCPLLMHGSVQEPGASGCQASVASSHRVHPSNQPGHIQSSLQMLLLGRQRALQRWDLGGVPADDRIQRHLVHIPHQAPSWGKPLFGCRLRPSLHNRLSLCTL